MTPHFLRGVGRSDAGLLRNLLTILVLLLAAAAVACGNDSGRLDSPEPAAITVDALHQRLQSTGQSPLLVDVRTPQEFAESHIEGARLAPFSTVVDDLQDVPKDQEIVLVCVVGSRSSKAQKILASHGYSNLRNLEGGMRAWRARGYPVSTN